ncbi:hypothetical protein [Xenophilus azovorans]|uniref:hypothetical protein n=1 Tax=Xenophilus azovorans TaxID=151755 RepID=UPI0012EEBAAB|nr:hypothetical protein [Xenophilus azovorans]
MVFPVNARLQAAHSFVRDVRSAHAFFIEQDPASADERYELLLQRLQEARGHLRWNPAAGRPARFLQAQSTQGRVLAARAMALAAAHGFPHLRELVVKRHVLLCAHDENRVLLLALKHERQLMFKFDQDLP